MTGGILHTGEMVGAVTGGILHTGNRGSGGQEGQFIPERAGAATGGILQTGDGVKSHCTIGIIMMIFIGK